MNAPGREHWGTRLGLVLAMAGNAVGLGNFLRFPVQATQNGGGAFMIPYFIAMVLVALPLMWTEWGMGRYGGRMGHGTMPGIFASMWQNPVSKYLGALGIFMCLGVVIYYTYIESACLGYSVLSLFKSYWGVETQADMGKFLGTYMLATDDVTGTTVAITLFFFVTTVGINAYIMYKGISGGIEVLAKIALPALFLFAIVLILWTFLLGENPEHPEWTPWGGLAFVWNPPQGPAFWETLTSSKIWLAATGQVFFTLSLGFGAIACYASYLRPDDDVALTGLATASTNEFAEVILGASLAIPIAFMFFGPPGLAEAAGGSFSLGFVSMPFVFKQLPAGPILGLLWFGLLFFAGITSSVALTQPAVAFLEDEFQWTRARSVLAVWVFIFLCALVVIFGPGVLDEMDYWSGTFGLVVFALLQAIVFAWLFGIKDAWSEVTRNADIPVPVVFPFILKYITPVYIFVILATWTWQEAIPKLFMNDLRNQIVQPEVVDSLAAVGIELPDGPDDSAPQALRDLTELVGTKDLLRAGPSATLRALLRSPDLELAPDEIAAVEARYEQAHAFVQIGSFHFASADDAGTRGEIYNRYREKLSELRKTATGRWIARWMMIGILLLLWVLVFRAARRIDTVNPDMVS